MSSEGIKISQESLFLHTFLCESSFFFCSKGIKTIQAMKIVIIFLMLFLIILLKVFHCNITPSLSVWNQKKKTCFLALSYVLKRRKYILRTIARLSFSNFSHSLPGFFHSSPAIFTYNRLNFRHSLRIFSSFFYEFMGLLYHIESIY